MQGDCDVLSSWNYHAESDPTDLLLLPELSFSHHEYTCSVLAPCSTWGLDSTSSIFTEDGDTAIPLEESQALPWPPSSEFETSTACDPKPTPTQVNIFQCRNLPDRFQLPVDKYLLGLGDVFAQNPSSTLTFAHSESEADFRKHPLSGTFPDGCKTGSYTCDHCCKIFSRPSQLRKHRKIHDKNDRTHRCNECNLGFHYHKDLRRHRRTKHQLFEEFLEVYRCPVSGCQLQKEFTRKDKFKEHIQKQHAILFHNKPHKDAGILGEPTSRSDQSYSNLFVKSFHYGKTKSTLEQDVGKKSHRCPFEDCDRTDGFASRVDLCRHVRSVHTALLLADSNGFFRCVYEGCKNSTKIYSRKDNFKRHITAAHQYVDHTEDLIERSKYTPYNAKVLGSEDSSFTLPLSSYQEMNSFQESLPCCTFP